MTLVEIYANEKSYINVKKNYKELDICNHVLGLCNDTVADIGTFHILSAPNLSAYYCIKREKTKQLEKM